jgi:hypothetical protein
MSKPRNAAKKHPGGRPRGVEMPCGWGCGTQLTAREMRKHFTTCPRRPTAMQAAFDRYQEDTAQRYERLSAVTRRVLVPIDEC